MRSRVQERADDICAKYDSGASLSDLAKEYGVYLTTIRNLLIKNGVTMRPPGFRSDLGHKFDKDAPIGPQDFTARNKQIREDYEAGATARVLAVKYNLHFASICRAVTSAGGTMRPRTRQPGTKPKGT